MILVEVEVPACQAVYDFRLDENLPTASLIKEMGGILFPGVRKEWILCSYEYERILPPSRTLWQSGIRDGAGLLFL